MDDLALFKKWIGTDQDEEMHLTKSEYAFVERDEPVEIEVDPDYLFWLELARYSADDLTLEDLDHIRRILHKASGRGTGYVSDLYTYPDYFSQLSLNVPMGWVIDDFLSKELWEGREVPLYIEAWSPVPKGGSYMIDWYENKHIRDPLMLYRNKNSLYKEVIISLVDWNENMVTHYFQEIINYIPLINKIDDLMDMFVAIPLSVWENITFKNTVPNEVLKHNWRECKVELNAYFLDISGGAYNASDPYLSGAYVPVDPTIPVTPVPRVNEDNPGLNP